MSSLATLKRDFPIFAQPRATPLHFLDSGASSQKPQAVLDAMHNFYIRQYANIHRGAYTLSEEATEAYEGVRPKVARFLGAPASHDVIFTRNATDAFNLLAYSYARAFLQAGDEVILTDMEHHANHVPWLVLAQERGVILKFIPLTPDGTLDVGALDGLLTPRSKLVTFAHVSNVLGCITDAALVTRKAHAAGAVVIVDGSQSAPHLPVNLAQIGCDFYICTGHKMLGPTGIGVLVARHSLLEAMPPFMTGGDMILTVGFDSVTWADPPAKFEAGTPAIVEAIGLGAAVDYLSAIGMDAVRAHERELIEYALDRLDEVPGVTVVGTHNLDLRSGLVSFTVNGLHPHDLAWILNDHGVCVRAGLHCAHPLHERLGIVASTRASFHIYNDFADIDALIGGIDQAKAYFRVK